MFNFLDLGIIPTFLSRFEVEKVLVIGLSNNSILDELITFCIDNHSLLYTIDSEISIYDLIKEEDDSNIVIEYIKENVKHFEESSLNILPNLESFDVVFINGDPNWYTVYNELNLIKKNNSNFPLVFVCNNRYPHKRRDSYMNPDNIPEEYKHECCNNLPIIFEEDEEIKHAMVEDGFCHAIYQNTPKNGVLTAVEDFLNQNPHLTLLDINPLEGVTLIYKDTNISHDRINKILAEEKNTEYNLDEFLDKSLENTLLLKHVVGINLIKDDIDRIEEYKSEIEDQNIQLKDYEYKIQVNNAQIEYKDSQINNIKAQVNVKSAQLQSAEATLLNKNNEIKLKDEELASKNLKLQNTQNKLQEVSSDHAMIENKYKELLEFNKKEIEIDKKEIEINKNKLNHLQDKFNALKYNYNIQLGKVNNKEYCISCYKEKIRNNEIEIEYIKKSDKLSKKLLRPLAYVYLIFKSKPNEIGTNIKLYKSLKNSKCFDIGYYLNKYPDIAKSKWCKYFSPELHYVCEGFKEKRKFNKKFFRDYEKKELIEDIKSK
ncbi:hypothetical protein [Methanobrevibacter sp.]|uniref:hypothetical protein n=1 Tax=Methanobrevibacter sp. TaxID=66852 RepID=UPI00386A0A66